MSSPSRRMTPDDLFREALVALVDVSPPLGQWERIVVRIPGAQARTGRWAIAVQRLVQAGSAFHGYGLISWLRGFGALYPVSAHDLIRVAPHGGCWPSPFAGIMAQRAWDLRLAS